MKRASSSSTSDPAPKRARDAAPTLDKPALRSLAAELSAPQHAIDNAVALLVDGHTVPFIARYRQQQTGGLEPPALRRLEDALKDAAALQSRLATILTALRRSERLTAELEAALRGCAASRRWRICTRRTRRGRARWREGGLGAEPAANALWAATVDDGGLRALVRPSRRQRAGAARRRGQDSGGAPGQGDRRPRPRKTASSCAVVKIEPRAPTPAPDKYRDFANDYERPLHAVPSHAWLAPPRRRTEAAEAVGGAARHRRRRRRRHARRAAAAPYHPRSGGRLRQVRGARARGGGRRVDAAAASVALARAPARGAREGAVRRSTALPPTCRHSCWCRRCAPRARRPASTRFNGHKLAVVANASGAVLAHATVHTPPAVARQQARAAAAGAAAGAAAAAAPRRTARRGGRRSRAWRRCARSTASARSPSATARNTRRPASRC